MKKHFSSLFAAALLVAALLGPAPRLAAQADEEKAATFLQPPEEVELGVSIPRGVAECSRARKEQRREENPSITKVERRIVD